MEYIIGIDIGTSATKTIAFSISGRVLHQTRASYAVISNKPGEQELNPDLLLKAAIKTIRELILKSKKEPVGIAFSCAMHSLIAVDKNGKPLTNAITWADLRSRAYAKKLRFTEAGKRIYERTGTPIHPMSPLCKLMWMKDNQPRIFSSAHKFISIKEYIWFHFFGKFLVDYSIASASGLFDIYLLKWNEEALQAAGITADRLSFPVPPTHIQTELNEKYKHVLGLPSGLSFIIGGNDGCLANLGSHVISPGVMALTIGTSGALRMTSQKPQHDSKERIFNYVLKENLYVSGGAVNNGGNAVKWYVENFMPKKVAESKNFATYIRKTSNIPAGSEGLIFLPYLLGERAPVWDADAKGVFFGVRMNHDSRHFLRSVMEGVGFSLYQIYQSLEQTVGPANKIYASGGFIRSTRWLQMIADIFDKPVYVMNMADASATGAAIMGLYALGKIKNLEEVDVITQVHQSYRPDKKNHKVYLRNFSIFDVLYDKLRDEFDK
ncbi:MAG TPA: gluconokinase [Puia sp.]|nr:gluconokinase [Puia sp.]